MCTFEYIKSMPEDVFKRMSERGVFCSTIKRDIEIYEYFVKLIDRHSKEVSYQFTAEHFKLSYFRTKKIILKFK